jgi:hypothetical protein
MRRAKVAELADAPDLGSRFPKAAMLKGFRGLRLEIKAGSGFHDAALSSSDNAPSRRTMLDLRSQNSHNRIDRLIA